MNMLINVHKLTFKEHGDGDLNSPVTYEYVYTAYLPIEQPAEIFDFYIS
ncbi:MAG: hypothetical protein HYU97_05805 [Deltaproteobacteria bacterium]|nr:hypothetical protein [Deltaproteobacteria bacterium]